MNKEFLYTLLDSMSVSGHEIPLQKKVIEERYLEDKSQDETAKTLGLSQVKVSRIERQGKETMLHFINS